MLHFVSVNLWAVIVAALVQIAVGGVWNGWLFVRAFYESHEVKEGVRPSLPQALVMVALTIINSYILFNLFRNLGVTTATGGLKLAFWLWLALLAPFIVGTGYATGRKKTIVLELGHTLLAMLAAGLVLGAWH
jgi:hypothetical protein